MAGEEQEEEEEEEEEEERRRTRGGGGRGKRKIKPEDLAWVATMSPASNLISAFRSCIGLCYKMGTARDDAQCQFQTSYTLQNTRIPTHRGLFERKCSAPSGGKVNGT